jgi:cysteine sulfinate desulfinase/cysteine desulfurase-like protein
VNGAVIYLDNNATTQLDERALEAMLPYLKGEFGNPASTTHAFGWTAGAAVEVAREQLAEAIGASPEEIIFTSGATEADNWALKGMLGPGDHLITAATEHEAILETAGQLERAGVRVTVLGVDGFGVVEPESLRQAITPEATLVSVMVANNETGTLNPVGELAKVAHEAGVPFHTDAAQALGKVPVDVTAFGADLMSLSAHKCYGPKGIGTLYVRRRPLCGVVRSRPEPLLHGGGQERQALGGDPLPCAGCPSQRASRASSAQHAERHAPRRGRGRTPCLVTRCGRLGRLGLRLLRAGSLARAARDGPGGRSRALLPAVRPRSLYHGRTGRARGAESRARRAASGLSRFHG